VSAPIQAKNMAACLPVLFEAQMSSDYFQGNKAKFCYY